MLLSLLWVVCGWLGCFWEACLWVSSTTRTGSGTSEYQLPDTGGVKVKIARDLSFTWCFEKDKWLVSSLPVCLTCRFQEIWGCVCWYFNHLYEKMFMLDLYNSNAGRMIKCLGKTVNHYKIVYFFARKVSPFHIFSQSNKKKSNKTLQSWLHSLVWDQMCQMCLHAMTSHFNWLQSLHKFARFGFSDFRLLFRLDEFHTEQ